MSGLRMAQLDASPRDYPGVAFVGGKVRVFNERVNLAAQASGSALPVGQLPAGAIPLFGVLITDTTLGTAQISIGTATAAAKYRAAGTLTTVDAPVFFGIGAAVGESLAAGERVLLTTSVAALPASGVLRVYLFYVENS